MVYVVIMDVRLLMILAAACVCGSYKNKSNRPPTFKGNFASAEDKYKPTKKEYWPRYVTDYPRIVGNQHLIRKNTELAERAGVYGKVNYFDEIYSFALR